jgi:hypothetical protein
VARGRADLLRDVREMSDGKPHKTMAVDKLREIIER